MKKFNQLREEVATVKTGEVIYEARASLTNQQYNVLRKAGLERLMKKHDAYVSHHGAKVVVISSPSAKFFDLLSDLFRKNAKKFIGEEVINEALNLVLSFGLKGNLPDGDGKKLIDTFAKKARVKIKHMMGGFEVYGDPISQNRFLNNVVSSKPLLKYLDTK